MAKNRKVPRAGFIPYYRKDDQLYMMFMLPSDSKYGGSKFQIAKGKVEDGETPEEAAIREAGEELGLRKNNLISVYHLGKFLGYTDVYFGEVKNMEDFDETTYETAETTWMTPAEFLKSGRSIHIPIVKSMLRHVP